jgi:4-hydroxy-3-methylbut-2-enyl diphosphate reductase
MKKDSRIIRRGFGLKNEVRGQLNADYHSSLIDRIVANDFQLSVGERTFFLAREFGFCYGVDRAIVLAYETRRCFPEKRIFITAEIIHNPLVNEKLLEMGFYFLAGDQHTHEDLAQITPEDIVLLPAFGISKPKLAQLENIGCMIVDTTCGSVVNVWRRVDGYARDGFTTVIHGKYAHEETLATISRCARHLVVRNIDQAREVCEYIEGRGDHEHLLRTFRRACSSGFDPDQDLARIGLANQTTMLSSDSLLIADMLRAALTRRYGSAEGRFRSCETVCMATQDRQDAVKELLRKGLDLMLVVGGFNSSNTTHLCKIAAQSAPAFHIDDERCLESLARIRHWPFGGSAPVETENWWPASARRIGFTAGASTPNSITGRAIARLMKLLGCAVEELPAGLASPKGQ